MKLWFKIFFAFELFLHTCMGSPDHFLDVESFLTLCTKRLNSGHYYEPKEYLDSENYKADQIVTVYLRGKKGEPKEYKIYDPDHRLMRGQSFEPKYGPPPGNGTRRVGFYSINEESSKKPRLCFKQFPEDPTTELAIYDLYQTLFSRDRSNLPLPASEIVLMNGVPFSMSQFMKGENLETILNKTKRNQKYCKKYSFDLESFQRLALFCFLTNPEDCRPQNCLVQKIPGSNKYRFVLIDNERNFCKEIVNDRNGEIKTRVHCSLFCFREMLSEKISYNLLRRNLMKDIYEWEKKSNAHSDYLARLPVAPQTNENQTELYKFNDRSPIKGLNKKLNTIKALFAKSGKHSAHAEIPLIDIFKKIMPKLAHVYLDQEDTLPEDSHEFQLALKRMSSIDAGRSGPPSQSSDVPLKESKVKSKRVQRAENGSFLGEISEATNRKKITEIKGYSRRNGTYVRGYCRS